MPKIQHENNFSGSFHQAEISYILKRVGMCLSKFGNLTNVYLLLPTANDGRALLTRQF